MCLLVFSINPNATSNEYFLILMSVRDESYTRPTSPASYSFYQQCIKGHDLEPGKEGGTWLAVNRKGKVGALLNILQPSEEVLPDKKGRGFLVVDYVEDRRLDLEEDETPGFGIDNVQYLSDISSQSEKYNQFLLLTIDFRSLRHPRTAYIINTPPVFPIFLGPGVHAFGNSITPDNPWPKVNKAKDQFTKIIGRHETTKTRDNLVSELFGLMRDRTQYPIDERMKKQGKGLSNSFLEKLSAIFVEIPESNYGSRCHTVILIDGAGVIRYYEKNRPEVSTAVPYNDWTLKTYSMYMDGCYTDL